MSGNLLGYLHTFECASRHLSFTLAAEELCLTPSAVSHRMKKLEKQLGFDLFRRYPRRLQLSNEGERLYRVLSGSLQDIQGEIQQIRNNELSGALIIFARPSITQCWLAPRLPDFHAEYPAITLDIRTGNEDIDFRVHPVDVALYYTGDDYPGMHRTWIMEESLFPVCTADYAERNQLLNNPGNLKQCLLLHDARAWPHAAHDSEWGLWAQASGFGDISEVPGFTFDCSDLAVTTALNGGGIAMGRRQLVQKRLDRGELVAPFNGMQVTSPHQYYALSQPWRVNQPKIRAFTHWLLRQTEGCGAAVS